MQNQKMIRNAILNAEKMEKRMPVKTEKRKSTGLLSKTEYVDNNQEDMLDSLRLKKQVRELFRNA